MGGKRVGVKPKPKVKTRTKFVILAAVNLTWYTVVVLVASFFDHVVPSELTIAWFAAWTAELALLAGIKIKGKTGEDTVG